MSAIRIVFRSASTPSATAVQFGMNRELRQQIRQSIQDAQAAAQAGRTDAPELQARVRDAQQAVLDAQQQLREARTADQRGAANQALSEAQSRLREAQAAVQGKRSTIVSIDGRPVIATGVAGAPGSVYVERGAFDNMIPPQAVDMAMGFFVTCAVIVIGWPIARALGRRIERRAASTAIDPGMAGQLQRIEQAVDAMAIEIERISESQRFMAKLQNGAAIGSGPPVERR